MAIKVIGPGNTDATSNSAAAGDSLVHEVGSQTMTVADFSALEEFVNFTILQSASPTYPASVPLKIALTGSFETYASGGTVYLHADNSGAGSATNVIANAQLLGPSNLFLGGTGTFTTIHQAAGRLDVAAGVVSPTSVYKTGGWSKLRYKTGAITTFTQMGGESYIERQVTNLNVFGGKAIVYRENQDGTPANLPGTITTATVGPNGTLLYKGGDITTLNAWGPVDCSMVTTAITIGTLNITAEAYEKSNFTSKFPGAAITLSATNEVVGHFLRQ